MSLKQDFGTRIKELRKKSGMTQEKFAEAISIDPKHLSHIETGRSFPKADLIEKMSAVLNVKYQSFFENKNVYDRKTILQEIPALTQKLSDRDLKIVYKLICDIVH